MSRIITLDVGGTLFKTNVAVLQKYPDSLLCAMFDHKDQGMEPLPKTENGNYFLDADPEYLRVILNFLRHGKVILDDPEISEGVFELAHYLGVEEVILEALEGKIKKNDIVVLNLNGEREIKITKQQLTSAADSKMAEFFSGQKNELSDWIVKENKNRYFISRPKRISEMVFDFIKSRNYRICDEEWQRAQNNEATSDGSLPSLYWTLHPLRYELEQYGIYEQLNTNQHHYRTYVHNGVMGIIKDWCD